MYACTDPNSNLTATNRCQEEVPYGGNERPQLGFSTLLAQNPHIGFEYIFHLCSNCIFRDNFQSKNIRLNYTPKKTEGKRLFSEKVRNIYPCHNYLPQRIWLNAPEKWLQLRDIKWYRSPRYS